VQIEQARFDEANNISYAEQMQTEGIELILDKGTKGHSKYVLLKELKW
jgi:polyphosphate kinase